MLDQISPIFYVPVVLFYSAPEDIDDDMTIFHKLKKSLSGTRPVSTLWLGRIEGNTSVDCEDGDVVFTRARANIQLSEILKSPDMNLVQQLLPLDPYNIRTDKAVAAMAVQLNFFDCGGMGIAESAFHTRLLTVQHCLLSSLHGVEKVIRKINDDYVRKLQGEDGFSHACKPLKETSELVSQGEVEFYRFSSWVRFPFYNTDFGWGKPIWACFSNVPIKNVVILMSSSSSDGRGMGDLGRRRYG